MKNLKLFLLLLGATVGLTACGDKTTGGKTGEGIVFSAEVKASTSGTLAPTNANESKFDHIWAVAFDSATGNYVDAVKAEMNLGLWEIGFPAGSYKLYVVANATFNTPLDQALSKTSTEADFLAFVASQKFEEGSTLPMISAPKEFTYAPGADKLNLGAIELKRMVARIDVMNALPELTITKVVVKNLATKGVLKAGTMAEGSDLFTEATFDGLSISGNAQRPNSFSGQVYSFENTDEARKVSVTVHYLYGTTEESKEFIFDKMERNTLYSVQFVLESMNFNWGVATWESGQALKEIKGGTTEEPGGNDRQQALNALLAVNHFAKTDAKTFDDDNNPATPWNNAVAPTTVTFCEFGNYEWALDPKTEGVWGANSNRPVFMTWKEWLQTVTVTGTEEGQEPAQYRVPTGNELKLLVPEGINWLTLNWDSSASVQTGRPDVLADLFGVAGSGGNGSSDYKSVRTGEGDGYNNTVYAIRFRNTSQLSAYRYRMINDGEGSTSETTVVIRIKAIDINGVIPTLDQVANESYWGKDQYIEYTFPLNGSGYASDSDRGRASLYWGSDPLPGQTGSVVLQHIYQATMRGDGLFVDGRQGSNGNGTIRLVKI